MKFDIQLDKTTIHVVPFKDNVHKIVAYNHTTLLFVDFMNITEDEAIGYILSYLKARTNYELAYGHNTPKKTRMLNDLIINF